MSRQDVSLATVRSGGKDRVLLNGTQALVRLMLMQKARDRAAGLNTAGYVHRLSRVAAGRGRQQMTGRGRLLRRMTSAFSPG
jgi:indolepyruvate ferredoxin oxidoreductase